MFTTDSAINECSQLWKSCAEYIEIFLQGAPIKTEDKTVPAKNILQINNQNAVYRIKQGILKEDYQGNTIINYEDGDLLGADALFHKKLTKISSDFAIVVDEYDSQQLLEYIRADKIKHQAWISYLSNLIQSYQILIAHHKQEETLFQPEVRNYEKDDIIIQQGAKGDEVFTLISGNAQAYVDDTLVGEVKCDEVFGAIAALTDTPRTATIKAESQCTVLVVPSSRFRDLLESRPDTVTKLIQDMARAIISSNQKIISLSG